MLSDTSYDPFADMDVPDEVLKLREIVANKMTDRQRQAYELIGSKNARSQRRRRSWESASRWRRFITTRLSTVSEKISKDFSGRVKILPFLLPVTCKEDDFLKKER
ncbi:MAG TPA: hypothetical protein DCX23_02255 [Lachnospiraceae bacterium]|nr:hypothetical protein [Lachnospiraceae bacterium]